MLYKWSEKEGDNATYRKLAERFKQCERQDIVDEIKRLVTGGTGESMLSFNLLKFICGNGQKEPYCILFLALELLQKVLPVLAMQLAFPAQCCSTFRTAG